MKKIVGLVFLSCLMTVLPLFAHGQTVGVQAIAVQKPAYKPGEVLVKYKTSGQAAPRAANQGALGISSIKTFRSIGVQHVKLSESQNVEEALAIYRADPNVKYAEPNYRRYATAMPDDTHVGLLWGLHNTGQLINGTSGKPDADIDAPEAWKIATGLTTVVVAVVDSGVDWNHPDLAPNIWFNAGETPSNSADDDNNNYVDDVRGWDFVDNDNDPMDYNGHGTHVAGTVGAVGNNTIGIAGINWAVKIMPLRALDTLGSGWDSDLIAAIEYANAHGAHVINNSWGGGGFSQAVKDAIDASSAVVVCAAGNDGTDNDIAPHYPSSYTSTNIIAVAAANQNDDLASFSNYGMTSVDLAAPGVNIYSTTPARQTVWSDNFDDGNISPWTTGGEPDSWALTSADYLSPGWSITDSPAGDYVINSSNWVTSPPIDLSSHVGTKFEYAFKGSSELNYDFLKVQSSSDNFNWTDHYDFNGTTGGAWFTSYPADLKDHEGGTVYIGYQFISDNMINDDGWYIDDVKLTAHSISFNGTEYRYDRGTSMATPHVSGVAALLKAADPSLTNIQIKAAIENTVDPISGMVVASGGRVNAYNALKSLPNLLGDELAVDFGANGLYHFNGATWTNLAGGNSDAVKKWGDVEILGINFGAGKGLYTYDGTNWTQLTTTWGTDEWEACPGGIAVDFGVNGLYLHSGSEFTQLASWNPEGMVSWNNGNELAVNFGAGKGLYTFNGTDWTHHTTWVPEDMISWRGNLVVDYGPGRGLSSYDGTDWTKLADWDPEGLEAWGNGDLAVNFGAGRGLYTYNGTDWAHLTTTWIPEDMISWDDSLVVDFGPGKGLSSYDGTDWTKLANWSPEGLETWGKGDLAVNFGPGRGLYTYDGTDWAYLTTTWIPDANGMEDINLF